METDLVKQYFDWNNALRRYFLTESDFKVKLLCVDDDVLEIIGNKYNIDKSEDESFAAHFRKSVALSNEGRLDLISFFDGFGYHISRGRNYSLFQFARRLCDFNNPPIERYDLPVLAITSLFILLCSNDRQPRRSVVQALASLTGNQEYEEDGGFDYIPDLLNAIRVYDPSFDDNRRGARQNVGRLQYQKVLNQRELFLFKKFLFCHNIVFDETLSTYEDLMNYRVLGKLRGGEFRPLYDRIVQNNRFIYEDYFTRQIKCFDRAQFETELKNLNTQARIVGYLYLIIDFSYGQPRFSVYTDVPVKHQVTTSLGIIPVPLEESDSGLYPTNIEYHSFESYCHLTCNDNDYDILLGHNNNGPVFFKESNNYLVQTHTPEPTYSYYVLIRRNNLNAIEAIRNQESTYENSINELFGNDWVSFMVKDWRPIDHNQRIIHREATIKVGAGISVPGQRDLFFDKGLPSIIVPNSFNSNRITIRQGATTLGRSIHQHNERLYIDLDVPKDRLLSLADFRITVKDGRNAIDSYSVLFPQIQNSPNIPSSSLFTYDGWNRICLDNHIPSLRDNELLNCDTYHYGVKNARPNQRVSTWENRDASFRFIELLRASYLESGNLSCESINEIVNYLAGYYNFPAVQNKKYEYGLLRKVMVHLGYFNESYDENGCHIYQLSAPRLFPTGNRQGTYTEYVLYGSFISDQVRAICNITSQYQFIRPYNEEAINSHSFFALIPYYMTLSLNREGVERVQNLNISVEDNSLTDIILSYVKSPQCFCEDFLTNDNRAPNDSYDIKTTYPRVVYSYGRWRFEDGANMYDSYKPANQRYRRVPIPASLMLQYYCYLDSSPTCLSDAQGDRMAFLDTMPIPSLYSKCLSYIGYGLAEKNLVFGLDGFMGDKLIYRLTEYRVRRENHLTIASKLSGKDNPTIVSYQDFNSTRYYLYYVKSNSIYEPFQLHLYSRFFPSKPLAYTKKIGDSYVVYYRIDNAFYKLSYQTAVHALSAIIRDDDTLRNHIENNDVDNGYYIDNIAESKPVRIVKQ